MNIATERIWSEKYLFHHLDRMYPRYLWTRVIVLAPLYETAFDFVDPLVLEKCMRFTKWLTQIDSICKDWCSKNSSLSQQRSRFNLIPFLQAQIARDKRTFLEMTNSRRWAIQNIYQTKVWATTYSSSRLECISDSIRKTTRTNDFKKRFLGRKFIFLACWFILKIFILFETSKSLMRHENSWNNCRENPLKIVSLWRNNNSTRSVDSNQSYRISIEKIASHYLFERMKLTNFSTIE